MEPRKILSWNIKASIVYAVGVWTMLGSFFYFKYTGKYDLPPELAIPEAKEPNPNEVVYTTAHSKTTIIYKKDFVPWNVRFMNLINSFTGGDSSRGSDSSK